MLFLKSYSKWSKTNLRGFKSTRNWLKSWRKRQKTTKTWQTPKLTKLSPSPKKPVYSYSKAFRTILSVPSFPPGVISQFPRIPIDSWIFQKFNKHSSVLIKIRMSLSAVCSRLWGGGSPRLKGLKIEGKSCFPMRSLT